MSNEADPIESAFALDDSEAQVTRAVRRQGALSRTDLAEITGYSRAKMTAVVNGLIERGILTEVGDAPSEGGRRPRLLHFSTSLGVVAGIDLGATSVDVSIADFSGTILEHYTEPADVRDGPQIVIQRITELLLTLLDRRALSPTHVRSIGLGVPGPVEFSTGLLIAPPIMPGWEAYPIPDALRAVFPNATVMVDNDVNLMALGELRSGTGKDIDNFLYIKVGTGIGCGIVARGEIYRGSTGCAGDIGHISVDHQGPVCHCGNIGCLEAMAAGPAIARRAEQAALEGRSAILKRYLDADGTLTAERIARAASEGDRVSLEIIQDSGRMIGEVLAALVNFYNPALILIGGGVSQIGFQFLSSIRQGVLRRSLPLSTRHLRLDYSPLGNRAGMHGALALALEHLFEVS